MNAQLDEDWKPPPEAVMLRNCMTAAYSSGVATAVCSGGAAWAVISSSPWMTLAVRAPHPSQRATLSALLGLACGGLAASTSVIRCTKRNSLVEDQSR